MTRPWLPALALCPALVVALAPDTARAEGPEVSTPFAPTHQRQLLDLDAANFDTGWIPQGSPVQMRFLVEASNGVNIALPGQAIYDWRTEELRFAGDLMAGSFGYEVGLDIVASVKVDLSIASWESDLLGPYDWSSDALAEFTPYLLEGHPMRPALLSDQTGEFQLASIPLVPDILILSGNLDIDLFVDIEAELQCTRIHVEGAADGPIDFLNEDESLPLDPGPGPEDLTLQATAHCQLRTEPTLVIYPNLVVTALFDEYNIGGIEIPIDLPALDEEVEMGPLELSFPRPEPPEEPSDDGGETDGGESDEGGETEDDGSDERGESDGGESDESGTGDDFGSEDLDGCSCSSAPGGGLGGAGGGLGATGLALLALLGLRRRRDDAR